MTEIDLHQRDRRGDWRPAKLLTPSPVLAWPWEPLPALKRLFFFFFPWGVLYMAISALKWIYLMPDLSEMMTFQIGWVSYLLALNLGMVFVYYSAWHFRLYVQKAQGTHFKYNGKWLAKKNSAFTFGDQLLDNMFWALCSGVPILTAYEALTMWAYANGIIPYVSWADHPIYCTVMLGVVLMIREVHFYLIHRLIHWPPLYKTVHHLHHRNVNPGPWSGLSMHPIEHLIFFTGVFVHWIIPSHPIHATFHLMNAALQPAQGHSGFNHVEVSESTAVPTGDYFHYLHHKYFECNYGADGVVVLDKIFGTYHDGSELATEEMNSRLRAAQPVDSRAS